MDTRQITNGAKGNAFTSRRIVYVCKRRKTPESMDQTTKENGGNVRWEISSIVFKCANHWAAG